MKKIIQLTTVFVMCSIFVILFSGCKNSSTDAPTEIGVTRVFSKMIVIPDEEFKVDLYVNLRPSHTYYLFDEGVPKSFEIVEGEHNTYNHIKIVEIMDAESYVFTYKVKAPSVPGTYNFEGVYVLEGMQTPVAISGETKIVVK